MGEAPGYIKAPPLYRVAIAAATHFVGSSEEKQTDFQKGVQKR